MTTPTRHRNCGFTLIELMITVAIVAILAAVALPSYRQYIRSSDRAEAQAYMMTVALRQQQFLVDTQRYAPDLTALGVAMPARVSAAYTATMPAPGTAPPSFTLTLTPKPAQSAEKCGTLGLTHTGARTASRAGCW